MQSYIDRRGVVWVEPEATSKPFGFFPFPQQKIFYTEGYLGQRGSCTYVCMLGRENTGMYGYVGLMNLPIEASPGHELKVIVQTCCI